MTQTATLVVHHKVGLHARPATLFVQSAMNRQSDITVTKGEKTGNGKSLMGILALAVHQDDEITITASGADEAEAVAELVKLVENNFGE